MIPWRKRDFLQVTQEAVTKSELGVEGVAEHLHKRPNTLYKELNPFSAEDEHCTAKLGVLDWLLIMKHTNNLEPLHLACKIHDHVAVPIPHPDRCNASLLEAVGHDAKETGEHLQALAELMGSCPKKDRANHKRLAIAALKECEEAVAELAATREHLKVLVEEMS